MSSYLNIACPPVLSAINKCSITITPHINVNAHTNDNYVDDLILLDQDTNYPLITVSDEVITTAPQSLSVIPAGILTPIRIMSPIKNSSSSEILLNPQTAVISPRAIISTKEGDTLSFLCWNIRGLTDFKLDQHRDLFKRFDFICLTEAWSSEFSNFSLEGYEPFNFPREKIHANAKRPSGGIYLFINRRLLKGIDVGFKKRDWVVWGKMKKDFLNFRHDLYVASLYIPPIDSTHAIDEPFSIIESDITSFSADENILLLGDHN